MSGPAGEEGGALLLRPRIFAPVLLGAGLGLSVWYAGFRLGGNDEGALLTAAGKILRGGVFYRDIDAYPFPGSHYLLAAVMAIFGEHLSVARALATSVFCSLLLTLYATGVILLGRRRAALFALSLLCFKFLAWPAFTAFFYWDLALLGACLAILVKLWRPPATGPFWSGAIGACVGLAFVAKQSMGIYLGGALLALAALERPLLGSTRPVRARLQDVGGMAVGFAVPVVPMVAYFASQGLLGRMFHSGLLRPLTDYAPTSGISFLVPLRWWEFGTLQGLGGFSYFPESYWTLLRRGGLWGDVAYPAYWAAGELLLRVIYTSVPLAFVGAGLVWAVARRGAALSDTSRMITFSVLTLAATFTIFPRADFAHLMGVYPLILLLLFVLERHVSERLPAEGWARRLPKLEAAAVAAGLLLCAALMVAHHAGMTAELRLGRAELRVHPEDVFIESVVRYVEEEVPEGESLFVYGHEAQYYFLTGRYSPWPFSQLYPGQDGGEGGSALAKVLQRSPPALVIRGFVHFPGVPGLPEQAPALDAFMQGGYQPDSAVFERYPLGDGPEPALHRLVVMRRRSDGASAAAIRRGQAATRHKAADLLDVRCILRIAC